MKKLLVLVISALFLLAPFTVLADSTDSVEVVVTVTEALVVDIEETTLTYDLFSDATGIDESQEFTVNYNTAVPCDIYMSAPSGGDAAWAAFMASLSPGLEMYLGYTQGYSTYNVGDAIFQGTVYITDVVGDSGLKIKDVTDAGPFSGLDTWKIKFDKGAWIAVNGTDPGLGTIEISAIAK